VSAVASLIDDIETSFRGASSERRATALRRVADLFREGADDFDEQQLGLFDDVLCELIKKIERQAIVELSNNIGRLPRAPSALTRQLSRHDDIDIAGPVLRHSPLLSDSELVEIAQTKSQSHLVAIATRRAVSESVSDVLIDRGNTEVLTTVAGNFGARLSTDGMGALLSKAESNGDVAAAVVRRADLSPEMFRKLLARASAAVQQRLLATRDSAMRARLQTVLQDISINLLRDTGQLNGKHEIRAAPQRDLDRTKLRSELHEYAAAGRLPETLTALGMLSGLAADTLRRLMSQGETDALLIVCKASELGWRAARAVIDLAAKVRGETGWNSAEYLNPYTKITGDTAKRVLRFLSVRKVVSGAELRRMLES
jgi:uncharacterized protein (DUF2336 family)